MPVTSPPAMNRRPLKSRSTQWAATLANTLVRTGVSPNSISVTSVAFALLGALLMWRIPTVQGLVGVAICVQLRLLCNLLDGMVAIEGKRQSSSGALYNEIPDRVADSLFIVSLGYAIGRPDLGWLGALAAAVTAYIRVLGGSLGLAQDFRGPMAKPHRMATLTVACLLGAVEFAVWGSQWSLMAGAWVIAIGGIITCVTRSFAISALLRNRA